MANLHAASGSPDLIPNFLEIEKVVDEAQVRSLNVPQANPAQSLIVQIKIALRNNRAATQQPLGLLCHRHDHVTLPEDILRRHWT